MKKSYHKEAEISNLGHFTGKLILFLKQANGLHFFY